MYWNEYKIPKPLAVLALMKNNDFLSGAFLKCSKINWTGAPRGFLAGTQRRGGTVLEAYARKLPKLLEWRCE
jgi:hypothetical protein